MPGFSGAGSINVLPDFCIIRNIKGIRLELCIPGLVAVGLCFGQLFGIKAVTIPHVGCVGYLVQHVAEAHMHFCYGMLDLT